MTFSDAVFGSTRDFVQQFQNTTLFEEQENSTSTPSWQLVGMGSGMETLTERAVLAASAGTLLTEALQRVLKGCTVSTTDADR